MDNYALYKSKLRTPEEAVKIVKSGDWVDYSQTCSFPEALDAALAGRRGELKDVKVRNAIAMKPVQVVEQDPEQTAFTYNAWHCSGIDRKYVDQGRAYYNPMLFRDCGSYYSKGFAPVNVAMISVTPMDKHGYFNFGLTNCCMQEMLDAAEHIVLEVNEHMPKVYGMENDHIHISQVDFVVEGGKGMSFSPAGTATGIDKQIAGNIFPYLRDGITLQIGIGGMPNALGGLIADSDLKDLGMHTELMSDGYLKLYQAGKITNSKKELNRGKGVFSICSGSQELYDFLDENQDILSAPMYYVNNLMTIRQFNNFVSINGCVSMDLYGQVCSESSGTRHISGTGGQLDFVTGAHVSKNGKAFLAMASTFTDKQGIVHSRINSKFTKGDIITTPRTQTPYMVTEYGVAELLGRPTWQRAEAIISIAHPDFRESLIQSAEEQKIWRRSNKR
ncbi:acetyl-CoA hydrolase/transferase family protein [Anaerotignum sp.]|uniref:acetyl-CoA hydrolase/transferase family protein n=1 Tax=Anaerotignum sp. TaxID=2039241 RepID=UPI00271539A8|nr:acetyl-CoA hydrolase/transferase C-terminal domain-containing protein [Anaerotignum sp.]